MIKSFMLVLCLALAAGCLKSTRSISNSSYHAGASTAYRAPTAATEPGFAYRGELSEFDVLGITRSETASEADIQNALANLEPVKLQRDSAVLLIQSGATFPDAPMVDALSENFRIVPFSGVPPESRRSSEGQFEAYDAAEFSRTLRLNAARGGCDTILCYWGVLEAANAKLATKTVSWVPVANWLIPDENLHMRLRLKIALVDVRTGAWTMLSPKAIESSKLSVSPRREVADQALVENLKRQCYEGAAKELIAQYAPLAAIR